MTEPTDAEFTVVRPGPEPSSEPPPKPSWRARLAYALDPPPTTYFRTWRGFGRGVLAYAVAIGLIVALAAIETLLGGHF